MTHISEFHIYPLGWYCAPIVMQFNDSCLCQGERGEQMQHPINIQVGDPGEKGDNGRPGIAGVAGPAGLPGLKGESPCTNRVVELYVRANYIQSNVTLCTSQLHPIKHNSMYESTTFNQA